VLTGAISTSVALILALLAVQLFVAANTNNDNIINQYEEDPQVGLKVTLRKESLEDAPSCMHTFAQLELLNLVSTD